ncbi:MAG: Ig-like domain-containing protein [Firmicutes bacterium]|nr:Ig-like domain-containing protein [Bacillota bacterium]
MPRIKSALKVCLLILVISFVLNVDAYGVAVGKASTLTMYPAVLEIPVGASLHLQVHSTSGAANTDLQWTSSNKEVATVSQEGYVTALSVGETMVEAVQKSSNDSAVCRVVVTESDKMLLYQVEESPEPPDDPSWDRPGEGSDAEIPVEQDPELDIPVEHDPTIDEYAWWIRIDDTIRQEVEGEDGPMEVVYHLFMNAVKVEGQTSRGTYDGGATLEVRVDTDEMVNEIMQNAAGILLSLFVDIGGTYKGEVVIEVEDYDVNRYTDFDAKPGELAIPPLVRYRGMALGEIELSGQTRAGGSSLDMSGLGINLYQPPIPTDAPVKYKLVLLGAGKVEIDLGLGLPRSFRGQISRQPFLAD